eukprot:6040964-Pyramimonas_sp.AAC.1
MGCGASKTTGSATLAPAPVSKPIALRTHEVDEVSDNSGNSVKRASTGNEPAPPPLAETPRSDGINLAEENAHKAADSLTERAEVPDRPVPGDPEDSKPSTTSSQISENYRGKTDVYEHDTRPGVPERDPHKATPVHTIANQRPNITKALPPIPGSTQDPKNPMPHHSTEPLRELNGVPSGSTPVKDPEIATQPTCDQHTTPDRSSKPPDGEHAAALEKASSLHSHACQSLAEGRHQDAEKKFTQCLTIIERVYGASHVELVAPAENLAWLLTSVGSRPRVTVDTS